MAGLNHEFCIIKGDGLSSHSWNLVQVSETIEVHDDLMHYFSDTLSWIPSYNPWKKKPTIGLCWYGSTIIDSSGIEMLMSAFSGWLQVFSTAPDIVSLTGNWVSNENGSPDEGEYEKITFSKNELTGKLSKIISFCNTVKESSGALSLFHRGM